MKIALDIDDTITKYPDFFAKLSKQHDCVIVTSRDATVASVEHTKQLMNELSIRYSALYFCDWQADLSDLIPEELEGAKRLLYQKVLACKKAQVTAIFDDDVTVQQLIKQYLPEVAVFSPV